MLARRALEHYQVSGVESYLAGPTALVLAGPAAGSVSEGQSVVDLVADFIVIQGTVFGHYVEGGRSRRRGRGGSTGGGREGRVRGRAQERRREEDSGDQGSPGRHESGSQGGQGSRGRRARRREGRRVQARSRRDQKEARSPGRGGRTEVVPTTLLACWTPSDPLRPTPGRGGRALLLVGRVLT